MRSKQRWQRVARWSAVARGAAIGLAVVMPVLTVGWWLVSGDDALAHAAGLGRANTAFDLPVRAGAAAIAAVSVLALSWGLWRLATTLGLFGRGQPFTPEAARGLRDFGVGAVAAAVFQPLAGIGLSLLLSSLGPGPRSIALSLSSDTLILMLLGAVLVLLGWALGEAALLAEENAHFI